MADLNKRLMLGTDIVYPYTKQENVINLQNTIKAKLPITSPNEPAQGTYVEKQVWLDTSEDLDDANDLVIIMNLPRNQNNRNFTLTENDTRTNWNLPDR